MKRRTLSLFLSMCLVLGLLPAAAFAQDTIQYVALGDSITTGYRLADDEKAFPEIIAEDNGYVLTNLANSGDTSSDLLEVVQDPANAGDLASADLITITIGGNDLMGALYEYLADAYNTENQTALTGDDVRNALTGERVDTTMLTFAADVIGDFASSDAAGEALEEFGANLNSIIAAIKSVNPDVTIIVANQYNPYRYLANEVASIPMASLTPYPAMFKNVADAFDAGLTQLNGAIGLGETMGMYSVADVYDAFNGVTENPCNASITIASPPTINLDFHPNAYGHELIAAEINDLLKDWTPPEGGEETPEPQVDSLWVNGKDVLVTEGYTVTCGSGTAVYDAGTNTLTLDNAKITNGEAQIEGRTIGISVEGGLHIVLEGENSIIVDGENSLGIYTDGGLSISSVSNGSLEITSGGTGIWTNGELSISGTANSSLKITSGGYGIFHAASNLYITDCTLTVNAAGNGLYNNSSTGKVTTQISGSNVTVNSAGGPAIGNRYISISDSTVSATGGGAGIDASYDLTITDSIVYAHSTGTYTIYSYYAGLKSNRGALIVSGDSAVTATALCEGGVGVEGFNMVIEQGAVLSAEGWMAAVRAYNSITVPDSYLPEGYSIRQVFNTCDADDDIYTIAEDGAEVTYTYEYILGGSSTDILTGAATSVILKEPAPVPDPDPDRPSHDRDDDDDRDPAATTESERNPDGSITTTVTRPDGTTVETTRNTDGSKEVVETQRDGTVVTTATDTEGNEIKTTENPDGTSVVAVTRTDGSTSATTVDEDGLSVTVAALSDSAAAQTGTVALPMAAVTAASDLSSAPAVTLDLPADTAVKVEIPVANVTPGTVAVLVKADGTSELVKTSVAVSGGVVLTLSGGETVKLVDNSKVFSDVTSDFWGADAVAFASSRELFNGTGATEFSPNAPMSRAMIVTVLARLDGVDTSAGGAWYEAGAQWAAAAGISDGSGLDQDLTREQLAAMLYRYAQYKGCDVSIGADTNILSYTDAFAVSEYAMEAMQWACGAGIIGGKDGLLDPSGSATRAEVAVMLLRFVSAY